MLLMFECVRSAVSLPLDKYEENFLVIGGRKGIMGQLKMIRETELLSLSLSLSVSLSLSILFIEGIFAHLSLSL